jgi:hypothetical protein
MSKLVDIIKSKGAPHSGKIEEVRNKVTILMFE